MEIKYLKDKDAIDVAGHAVRLLPSLQCREWRTTSPGTRPAPSATTLVTSSSRAIR